MCGPAVKEQMRCSAFGQVKPLVRKARATLLKTVAPNTVLARGASAARLAYFPRSGQLRGR